MLNVTLYNPIGAAGFSCHKVEDEIQWSFVIQFGNGESCTFISTSELQARATYEAINSGKRGAIPLPMPSWYKKPVAKEI